MRTMAFAAIVATAAAMAGAALAQPATPEVRAVSTKPLVVSGTGFKPYERVTVTALTSLRQRNVRVTASAGGRFRARLGLFPQACGSPFAVRARGARGTVASLRLAAAPCIPPPTL